MHEKWLGRHWSILLLFERANAHIFCSQTKFGNNMAEKGIQEVHFR